MIVIKFLKKHYKLFLFTLLFVILFMLLTSTLYYFNIISNNVFKWVNLICLILIIFVNSIKVGVRSTKNAYLEGFKFSLMIILLITLISLFAFNNDVEIKMLLYDLIIVFTSIFGSMIGINKAQKGISK